MPDSQQASDTGDFKKPQPGYGESQSYYGADEKQYPPPSYPQSEREAPYGASQPAPYGQEYRQEYPPAQKYTPEGTYGADPSRTHFDGPSGQGQSDRPAGAEDDRGFMGALAGGAMGAYGGHKVNHGVIGTIGGAIAGSMLQDGWKKHNEHNNENHHNSYNNGNNYDGHNNGNFHGHDRRSGHHPSFWERREEMLEERREMMEERRQMMNDRFRRHW